MSECDFCHYETETTEFDSQDRRQTKRLALCGLCSNTPAGNAAFKPWNHPYSDVLRTINFAANAILTANPMKDKPIKR